MTTGVTPVGLRGHPVASERTSWSASAAPRESGPGRGSARRSATKEANALGEQSSSGLVTTTVGSPGSSSAGWATSPKLRPACVSPAEPPAADHPQGHEHPCS